MAKNKGQITLIIAIAIFIFIIAAFIFYAANYYKNKNPAEPLVFERASIENYINVCVKKTAEDGLKLLGKQGYFIVLGDDFKVKNLNIGYLYYNNRNNVPTIGKIQDALSSYIKNNLNICLKDFSDFKKQGWSVEKGDANTKTLINEEDVLFEVDFLIKVSSKGSIINFEKFIQKADVRLKYIYEIVNEIVDFRSKYNRRIDITSLNNYDVEISVFDYSDFLIYTITDYKSLIINVPYELNIAIQS